METAFKFLKETYPEPVRKTVETLISELHEKDFEDAQARLDYFINVSLMKEARVLVEQLLGRPLHGLHVSFNNGCIEKQGDSAGLATAMSIWSAATETALPVDLAFTGAIDILGYVYPVGGELQKIRAAEEAGCTRLFLPREVWKDLPETVAVDYPRVKLLPVEHIRDVLRMLDNGKQVHVA